MSSIKRLFWNRSLSPVSLIQIVGKLNLQNVVSMVVFKTSLGTKKRYIHSGLLIFFDHFQEWRDLMENCKHLHFRKSQFLDELNYCLNSYRFSSVKLVKLQIPSILHFVLCQSSRSLE